MFIQIVPATVRCVKTALLMRTGIMFSLGLDAELPAKIVQVTKKFDM